jgi:3-deoxy-D-manno-octulosonate 8-phosphate phosphatase (KDO 8-P phosphatase)
LILTDVDGVLTDGGRYYSVNGEFLKKFHVRDGMGVNLLLRNGIKTVIMTKEKSRIVKKWAREMNVSFVYSGILKKESVLDEVCKRYNLSNEEIAYIGDDVNDLELMKRIGFSATPIDGIAHAKQLADYVCKVGGGKGAFREVADLILLAKFPQKTKLY